MFLKVRWQHLRSLGWKYLGKVGGAFIKFAEFVEIHSGQSGFVPFNGLCRELRMLYHFLGILPDLSEERWSCL